jgi:integrase
MARLWEREAASGEDTARSNATLADAIDLLINDRKERAKAGRSSSTTVIYYQGKSKNLLRVLGASLKLSQLHARDVDRYISVRRGEEACDGTISKEFVALRGALKLAKRAGLWKGDVASVMPVSFSPNYIPRSRVLSPVELDKVLAQMVNDRGARLAFMVATSARMGETDRARREDVVKSMVRLRGTKTVLSARTVPVVAAWGKRLLQFAVDHAEGTDGLLFRPWLRGNYLRDIRTACKNSGVDPFTPNDLRRTCATWLRRDGVAPDLIAAVCGHVGVDLILRVYGRLSPEDLADRLGSVLAPTPSSGP